MFFKYFLKGSTGSPTIVNIYDVGKTELGITFKNLSSPKLVVFSLLQTSCFEQVEFPFGNSLFMRIFLWILRC